ncbi:MAG: B12-binding domain-containing radical SAM protein [Burkholderiales bacterium]|nr:B12-binding domain-containing radical SAM protein [Burkholderiales bacterium]
MRPPLFQVPGSLSCTGASPPIGLACIAGALQEAGVFLQILDAAAEGLNRSHLISSPIGPLFLIGLNVQEIVERLDPGIRIVGISHMYLHEWPILRTLVELLKATRPQIQIVLGGENATSFWPWIFRQSQAVDYCVIGEGEYTAVALVQALLERRDPEVIPGVVSARTGPGPAVERCNNPEALPGPAWDLFPLEKYLSAPDGFGVNRGRAMPILTSRGCPYDCSFCSAPRMWSRLYRTRPPHQVVQEMKSYIQRYGAQNFNFCDLTTILHRDWALEFCHHLRAEGLNVTWQLPSGTRSEALDEEVLRAIHAAGCRNLTYAPESGSTRMLRIFRKQVNLERMLESIRTASRVGLVVRVNVIIGHPDEERSDLWASLRLLLRCAWAGGRDAAVMVFTPYPGSRDFDRIVQEQGLEVDDLYCYTALARGGRLHATFNPTMGRRFLLMAQKAMLAAFYIVALIRNPRRIFEVFFNLLTGREETQLDQFLRTRGGPTSPPRPHPGNPRAGPPGSRPR